MPSSYPQVVLAKIVEIDADGKVMANLPKGTDVDSVTMEQAIALLEAKANKGKKPKTEASEAEAKPKKVAAKKPAAKKPAAKKAAKKKVA